MRTALAALLVALSLGAVVAGGGRADGEDPLGPIREEVDHLVEVGKLHAALVLLKNVNPGTLDEGGKLELRTLTAKIEEQKRRRRDADRAEAARLVAAGDLEVAAASLEPVKTYGSPEDVKWAEAEQRRLRDLAGKRAAEQAARAEAEAKAKKEALAKAAKALEERYTSWTRQRGKMICDLCAGRGSTTCKHCGGAGSVPVAPVGSRPCGKCKQRGWNECSCVRGFERKPLEAGFWEALPPKTRAWGEDQGVSAREFVAGIVMMRLDVPQGVPEAAKTLYPTLEPWIVPVKSVPKADVEVDETGAKGVVRAKIKVGDTTRSEDTSWENIDGEWFLAVPPPS